MTQSTDNILSMVLIAFGYHVITITPSETIGSKGDGLII